MTKITFFFLRWVSYAVAKKLSIMFWLLKYFGVALIKLIFQRYVRYGYESDSCRSLDQDGLCVPDKPEKRLHLACVTVGLETQVCPLHFFICAFETERFVVLPGFL